MAEKFQQVLKIGYVTMYRISTRCEREGGGEVDQHDWSPPHGEQEEEYYL